MKVLLLAVDRVVVRAKIKISQEIIVALHAVDPLREKGASGAASQSNWISTALVGVVHRCRHKVDLRRIGP